MMKLAKLLLPIVILLAAVPSAIAKDWSLVRFTYSSGWDALPAIVAQERGFFAEQGLVVSGMPVASAKTVAVSLGVGTTDLAAVPQETLLTMLGAQIPVTVVSMGGCCVPMELVVPAADTKTTSVESLKGKTIGISQGSPAFPILIRLLNRARLRPSDVKIKFLPAARLTNAFKEKLADAVFDTQHFTTTLTLTKQGRVAVSAETVAKELGNIDAMPLVVRTDLITKEPAVVQKFVNAWIKAQVYIGQDPKDAAKLLQIFFHRQGVPVSDGLALSWVSMTKYNRYVWGKAEVADAEYNSWAIKTGGLTKTEVKLAGAVNNSFSERAYAQLEKDSGQAGKKAKP
jgi:ABC-type nitrate/sulfonate/bicarbonate transport system substrate-binding protein